MTGRFRDRRDAGRQLARSLVQYGDRSDVVTLGVPRGGVPVAFEVAATLDLPLDVLSVRRLLVPGQRDLSMGVVASGGLELVNPDVTRMLEIGGHEVERAVALELLALAHRERVYRHGRAAVPVRARVALVIDDGLATGASMLAAVRAVRSRAPARIVVAVPAAAADVLHAFRDEVDEVVCLVAPEPYIAVARWYEDFSETSDEDVRRLMDIASRRLRPVLPTPPHDLHRAPH